MKEIVDTGIRETALQIELLRRCKAMDKLIRERHELKAALTAEQTESLSKSSVIKDLEVSVAEAIRALIEQNNTLQLIHTAQAQAQVQVQTEELEQKDREKDRIRDRVRDDTFSSVGSGSHQVVQLTTATPHLSPTSSGTSRKSITSMSPRAERVVF